MNEAQVNQEWWKTIEAQRAASRALIRRSSEHRAAAAAWVRKAMPDMVDDGDHVDPWAVMGAQHLKSLNPDQPVTTAQVREFRAGYEQWLHDRGVLRDDDTLTERVAT